MASGKQWTLAFAEEFNGTSLDTTRLTPCFDWNLGGCTASFNTGKEHYQPSQVQVSNGTAKLVAEPLSPPLADNACYQGQCTYKAGLVSTARTRADNGSPYLFAFTYGYIESRMKFPGTAGFFTAFWMLPTNPSFNYATEIDIVEILGGQPETIWMHYHYNNRSSSYRVNTGAGNNGACQVRNYSTDWVRFGLDWQPAYVAWYIDGVKCGQFNGNSTTIETGPMQLILHMMIDNQWERSVGSVLSSQTLSVSWRLTTFAFSSSANLAFPWANRLPTLPCRQRKVSAGACEGHRNRVYVNLLATSPVSSAIREGTGWRPNGTKCST